MHFTYQAKKNSGEIYNGALDAQDHYELFKILKESGSEVISYKEHNAAGLKNVNITLPFLSGVKMQEKINFARNLGSMIQAGLPASRALMVMERQTKNLELKKIIHTIGADISKGMTLDESISSFPKVFSPLFISMVKAGEQSGTLSESLRIVALQMDRSYTLNRRIRGALIYPSVIISAMVIIAIILLEYIVPTLTKTFSDLHVQLPGSTLFILAISNIIRDHWFLLMVGLALIIGGYIYWSRTPAGKSIIHMFILRMPLFGGMVQEVNTARTARTLSSLLSSGVDMVESVRITKEVLQNVHYKKVLEKAEQTIKNGDPLSKIFSENDRLYPTFFSEMMSVGEETGKMGEMLLGVAQYYEDDVEQSTKDMSTIIEPVIMVLIGAGVGFFAVAMISPMYSLVNVI